MQTGRKIMNMRLDKDITQREMARACGISAGGLSKIETGINKPSAPVLRLIARALGTTADYLLDDAATYPPLRPALRARPANEDPDEEVTVKIRRQDHWLLEDLACLGRYWQEAALSLPGARMETIRLVRHLLQRDQLQGAMEAEKEARKAAGRGASGVPRAPRKKKTGVKKRPRGKKH